MGDLMCMVAPRHTHTPRGKGHERAPTRRMNRGIYLAPSSSVQAAPKCHVDLRSPARIAEADRCPASLIARATRLSNLYGVSLTTKLARKGAGERLARTRHQQPRNHHPANGSPGSSRERERVKSGRTKASRKQKRILRSALEKAGGVALRLTMEVSAGVKAFDGPPLKPSDVKDLFLRNFRVRLSASEAEALIMHFTSSTTMDSRSQDYVERTMIEHGRFLQSLRRLRRELLKKQQGHALGRNKCAHGDRGGPESPTKSCSASLPSLHSCRDNWGGAINENNERQAPHVDAVVRALAKVDRAALSYDARRIQNLRQADLSRVSTPRAFGGVLRARFDVRVDPLEQSELVSLLQDENGTVDVERFRAYFLGLIENRNASPPERRERNLPPLPGNGNQHRPQLFEGYRRIGSVEQSLEGPYR